MIKKFLELRRNLGYTMARFRLDNVQSREPYWALTKSPKLCTYN